MNDKLPSRHRFSRKHGSRAFIVLTCLLSAATVGCADLSRQQLGTGIGAVLGGVAGAKISSKDNRLVGVVAGAALGGAVGSLIGKHLTEKERAQSAQAVAVTAQTGTPQQFSTSSGNTVITTPVKDELESRRVGQSVQSQTQSGPECRTVRQTIVLSTGTRESEDLRLCNGPNGWQPA